MTHQSVGFPDMVISIQTAGELATLTEFRFEILKQQTNKKSIKQQ
jgi:hypothetical protein